MSGSSGKVPARSGFHILARQMHKDLGAIFDRFRAILLSRSRSVCGKNRREEEI